MKKFLPFLMIFLVTSVLAQTEKLTQTESFEKLKNKIIENNKEMFGELSVVLRLDSSILSQFNDLDSTFLTTEKTEFSYTSIGLIKEKISGSLANNEWYPEWKTVYTYTPDNVLTNIEMFEWDISINNWTIYYKKTFTYNSLGQNTEIIYQWWNEFYSILENTGKESFIYNSFGKIDTTYVYTWNIYNNNWVYDTRVKHYYTSNQKISYTIVDSWNNSNWVGFMRFDWVYDVNNFLITHVFSLYSFQTFTYTPFNRILYTNNLSGHAIIEEHQSFNHNWVPYKKTEYTLDANNYIQQEIFSFFRSSTMEWSFDTKTAYFYTDVTSVNDFVKNSSVRVFPNPASDVLIINSDDEISNLRIFNINGQLVMSINPASKEATIDVSNFANGIYFVHTLSNDRNSVQKIIVQH